MMGMCTILYTKQEASRVAAYSPTDLAIPGLGLPLLKPSGVKRGRTGHFPTLALRVGF